MSRCFPYPPLGYYRNGAAHDALIESIKLQKKTNKTKADRKKEKKAKKEKRNNEDSVNLRKNTNDVSFKETKTITELYEKSDLTEEHGQPFSPHQPSYSSDSTQNSNKRKRDDYSLLPPDNSANHGSFKIRLLKKQKASNSNNLVADVRSNIYQPVPSSSNSNRNLVSNFGKNGVPSTSGRENGLHFGRVQSAKPIIQSTRRQQQVFPQIHLEHDGPSSYVSRNIDHHGISNPVSSKTSTPGTGKRSINEASVGPTKQTEETQKVGPTRTEKKMLKKHAKYEKLIGSWLPPVIQANLPDVGDDEDWLSRGKTVKSLMCKGEVEMCRDLVAPWQPCARFLAEVDVHALPYTYLS